MGEIGGDAGEVLGFGEKEERSHRDDEGEIADGGYGYFVVLADVVGKESSRYGVGDGGDDGEKEEGHFFQVLDLG